MATPTYLSGLLFTQAHKAVRACIYSVLETRRLTPTTWSIISAVENSKDGIRLTGIATQLDVKPPMISVMVDELIGQGILLQVPHHSDGRVKLLATTPKGRKLYMELERELDTEVARLMSGISANDAAVFRSTLQAIIANASK